MNNGNPFRRAKSPEPAEAPQATSDMTDAELDESLRQARRELLDARHEELREREKARHAPEGSERTKRSLGNIFNSNRRRFK